MRSRPSWFLLLYFHFEKILLVFNLQVNDLDSPDSQLTLATSSGYSPYPPPAIFFANVNSNLRAHLEATMPLIPSPYLFWPTFVRDDGRSSIQLDGRMNGLGNGQRQTESSRQRHGESQFANLVEDAVTTSMITEMETVPFNSFTASAENSQRMPSSRFQQRRSSGIAGRSNVVNSLPSPISQANATSIRMPINQSRPQIEVAAISSSNASVSSDLQTLLRNVEGGQIHQFIPVNDPARWELPFLQGWLMGQTHAGLHTMLPVNSGLQGNSSVGHSTGTNLFTAHQPSCEMDMLASALTNVGQSRGLGRSGSRHRSRYHIVASMGSGESATFLNAQNDETEPHSGPTDIVSEVPSLAAVATAELPCTVKLRIWPHDIRVPCATLIQDKCCLTIPHAVLCRSSCF